MSGLGIAMMLLICGLVWGGFLMLALKAFRSEGTRREVADDR